MRSDEVGYMCMIDFEDELYRAAGGTTIYASVEELKEKHDCWKQLKLYQFHHFCPS